MPLLKIVSCEIGPYPEGICDPLPKVIATFSDGSVKLIFDFFPDEISFTEKELIGLTEQEARELKGLKDLAYLRS